MFLVVTVALVELVVVRVQAPPNNALYLTGYVGGCFKFFGFVWLHRFSCSLSAGR